MPKDGKLIKDLKLQNRIRMKQKTVDWKEIKFTTEKNRNEKPNRVWDE